MNNILRIFLLILILTLSNITQSQNLTFQHLSTEQGLSQFSINSIYVDEAGLIWIGTREGLNCYNGNEIKTYKLEKENPHSLFCNSVLRITGDGQGHLFLLCTEGVAELDLQTMQFKTLLRGDINCIYYHKGLYIGQRNEVYLYSKESENFNLHYTLPGAEGNLSALHIDNEGCLWMGINKGGVFVRTSQGVLTHPITEGNISSIYTDSQQRLWIGSWEQGLYRVDKGHLITHFRHEEGKNSLSHNFVRSCCEDDRGNLWIGTFNGLNKYDSRTQQFTYYPANNRPGALSHSSVWCIVKDKQGTIWLGTYFGGVNYFNPEYEIYTHYPATNVEAFGLSSSIVGRMIEDSEGKLWIGTEGGGVNVYDRHTRRFHWYKHQEGKNSLSHDNVKSLYYDTEKQVVWIGTHLGGLNRLDVRSGHFTVYRSIAGDQTTLPSDIIRDIVPWKEQLVIATQNGVCLFDPGTGKCKQLFRNNSVGRLIQMVSDLHIDHKGRLWIAATGEGIFCYDFNTRKIKHYRHHPEQDGTLSNNNVNHILETEDGKLWFSTSGSGLDCFDPQQQLFTNYDSYKYGLASDCVYQTEPTGKPGQLALITNKGFSLLDTGNHRFRNYSSENGFPLTAINENGLHITEDGEVFLGGGMQGMVSFALNRLHFSPKPYRILLSRLLINGQEVNADRLSDGYQLTLQSDETMFSLEYALTNFIPANNEEIVYQLKGFSDTWNSTRGQHVITYTNLNAGHYTLIIRPADSKSLCQPVEIDLRVLPPFYRSFWAYIIYIVVAASVIFYLLRTYKGRLRLQESLKYEQKHAQDIELLNQSKLRFFTNISHEFRTPLTLIVGQMEGLLQSPQLVPSLYNKLLTIYKNSLQLKELISELLDFRKQEQGMMHLRVKLHNLIPFLHENYLLFLAYANTKQIHLVFEKENEEIELWYDRQQLQKVVNNLLSNAIKHTPAGGIITLSVSRGPHDVIIAVSDQGTGIRAEDIDRIFDRFYQSENEVGASGTGIGLALTKGIVELHHGSIQVRNNEGAGCSFVVKLPLGNNHFSPQEMSLEPDQIQIENAHLSAFSNEEVNSSAEEAVLNAPASILIVEDNDEIRQMLIDLFTPIYQVRTAVDGVDALEKLKEELPHIILSDVLMPRMSGIDLCKEVKQDFSTCHIPVVLLTARTAIEHNLEGLRIGADDYITKPFDTRILVSRCNNLVNSRIILQEKFSKQPTAQVQTLATNPMDKELLDKAMSILDKHLDNPNFNVNLFAREMGMARTSLFAKLKGITGQTPNDFILSIRLKRAALMLRNNPEMNVNEISDRTGFNSPRYFSKCFKDTFQISPLNYRRGEEAEVKKEE